MAIARSFRDGWLTSLKIDSLGNDSAELFLFRLGLKADKNGVYHGEPELLRAAAYPLQVSRRRLADVTRYRDLCARAGLLRLWTAADGRPYVQILNFRQKTPHERPQHPLPPGEPDETGQESLGLTADPPDPVPAHRTKGKERKESGHGGAAAVTPPAISDADWLKGLAAAWPHIDVRAELAACLRKYPKAGRRFFENDWLPNWEKPLNQGESVSHEPIPEPTGFVAWYTNRYEKAPTKPWAAMPRESQAYYERLMTP